MMFQQHQEIKKKVSKIPKRYVNVAICPVIVDIYTSLQEIRSGCKVELLKSLRIEEVEQVSKTICECICEIVGLYLNKKSELEGWPELYKELFELTQSSHAPHRQSAFYIFSSVPALFGEEVSAHTNRIQEILQAAVSPTEPDMKVRVFATRAVCAFVLAYPKSSSRGLFVNLTQQMLELIVGIYANQAASTSSGSVIISAHAAMQALVNIATQVPVFFRPNLRMAFSYMLAMANNGDLDTHERGLAVELLVSLAENRPGMIRKLANQSNECALLIQTAFRLIVSIEEEAEAWLSNEDPADLEEEELADLGEQALDRLSRSLGGRVVLPYAFEHINNLVKNPDWRCRHAALKGVSAVAEGGQKQLLPLLSGVIETVLQFLSDPHPRVRYAACHALGQLATDMHPKFQRDFHSSVLPGLLQCMEDSSHRVQAHAAAALVNFCEHATSEILAPYLVNLAYRLYGLLNSRQRMVVEQAVVSIATVADSVGSSFSQFYGEFMPVLKNIFITCTDKESRTLRGKTLECMTFIGLAVHEDNFKDDAVWIMETLHTESLQSGPPAADDPMVPFLLSAHGRICKTLGKNFVQYLPSVLPPLLESAKLKPDLSITSIDAEDAAQDSQDKSWDYLYMQNYVCLDWLLPHSRLTSKTRPLQKIGIKSSTLEDKCTACEMLVLYVETLKEGFGPYLNEVAEIMIPLLEFYYHDGVRVAAAQCTPHLLAAAISSKCPSDYILSLWGSILSEFIKVLKAEDDAEMLVELLSYLKDVIFIKVMVSVMHGNCVSAQHLADIGHVLVNQFKNYRIRVENRLRERKDVDYDEGVEEELGAHDVTDELFISSTTSLLQTLFSALGLKAVPLFEQLTPVLDAMLATSPPLDTDLTFVFCILADLVRYCGNGLFHYVERFKLREMLVHYALVGSYNVRGTACFAMGVLALYGGPQHASVYAQFVPPLLETINEKSSIPADDERAEEFTFVYENAVSAIGKICSVSPPETPGINGLLRSWLNFLPIIDDEEECQFVYDYLCSLIERGNPVILGENNANVPFISDLLNTVVQKNLVGSASNLDTRCRNILVYFGIPSK
ncbi:hypothetical protein Zmor_011821 [Zophobas morio]|uniref:TOG domain-containing protein n=1 Tax=Zophobas morio TaxID=2755281 RepID=A0AA38LZT2_9CUCU|nr:hypothetical protein Zmor_011821 [Zophobas morio]